MDLNGYKTDIEKCQNLKQLEGDKNQIFRKKWFSQPNAFKNKRNSDRNKKKEYGQKINLLKKAIEQAIGEKNKSTRKKPINKIF
jgi:hypothetical protein